MSIFTRGALALITTAVLGAGPVAVAHASTGTAAPQAASTTTVLGAQPGSVTVTTRHTPTCWDWL